MPRTTVYAKYALSPIPADSTNGRFARNAMQNDAIAEANAVAVKIAPESMPVAPRMLGLTARI